MKKKTRKGAGEENVSESVLGKLDKIIPGFHGFFKKMEGSKAFGFRVSEIRKEINRKFGKKSV